MQRTNIQAIDLVNIFYQNEADGTNEAFKQTQIFSKETNYNKQ